MTFLTGGGISHEKGQSINSTEYYSPATNAWRQGVNLPDFTTKAVAIPVKGGQQSLCESQQYKRILILHCNGNHKAKKEDTNNGSKAVITYEEIFMSIAYGSAASYDMYWYKREQKS